MFRFQGTGAFVAELLIIFALAKTSSYALFWLLLATVVGVSYNFLLFIRVFFGPFNSNDIIVSFSDLNDRELTVLAIFVCPLIFSGLAPEFFLNGLHAISCL
jgi:NADH:ubiquinone oxidoreductase subunit 4 (subunit M)